MTRIFISYSRSDETFARQVAIALSKLNADIWIDVEDIPAGMKWSRAIQEGLDTANALIVIISPESMASRNVEDEWQYFLDHDKPVIPIFLREAKIHFQLNRIQWIDFKNQPFDVALIGLHGELKRNGIHLEMPPRPSQDLPPLQHGHTAPPEPKKAKESGNSMLFYAGGAIAIVAIILIIGFLVNGNGNNNNTAATLDAQNTRIAELERMTQAFIDAQGVNPTTSPSPTRTQVPATSTPTDLPTPTPPSINLGPVTDNSAWEAIEVNIDGVAMVLVPSGTFRLGTTEEHYEQNIEACLSVLNNDNCRELLDDEFNGASITINDPYWIDKYEVSEQVYGSSNSNLPQVNITGQAAEAFCGTRGGALPSEAEWEFAAKGPSGWRYPWGNSWDLNTQRANICDANCSQSWTNAHYNDGYAEIAPVTEFHSSASWVGAFNMAGNVWEWTSDPYASDTTNTLRGGGFTWIQGEATTTSRADGIAPQAAFYGFRCIRPYVEGDLERYN